MYPREEERTVVLSRRRIEYIKPNESSVRIERSQTKIAITRAVQSRDHTPESAAEH